MANTQAKIYVAGHRGMVGAAIASQLAALGHGPESIITRTHAELDLTNQAAVPLAPCPLPLAPVFRM